MDTTEFFERLGTLDGPDLVWLAQSLRHETGTADGEVAWWRATTAVSAILRRQHRSREAGLAAHRAAEMVLDIADRGSDQVDRADATLVARAAADVARALVAGDTVPATSAATLLLQPFVAV